MEFNLTSLGEILLGDYCREKEQKCREDTGRKIRSMEQTYVVYTPAERLRFGYVPAYERRK